MAWSVHPEIARPKPMRDDFASREAWQAALDDWQATYMAFGGWYAVPGLKKKLMGRNATGKDKFGTRCAALVFDALLFAMIDAQRAGRTYETVPAIKWSDKRKHALATDPISQSVIAKATGFHRDSIQLTLKDLEDRGVLASCWAGRLKQYAFRMEEWDQVAAPVVTDDADEPDADEPDADEPDADEPDADEPDADEPDAVAPFTYVLSAGQGVKFAKPMRMTGMIPGDGFAAGARLSCTIVNGEARVDLVQQTTPLAPSGGQFAEGAAAPKATGDVLSPLSRSFSQVPVESTTDGERKANANATPKEPSSPPQTPQPFTSVSVLSAPANEAHDAAGWQIALDDLAEVIFPGMPVAPIVVEQVTATCTKAGKTPVDYVDYVRTRVAQMLIVNSRALAKSSPARFPWFANDAVKEWAKKREPERPRPEHQARLSDEQHRRQTLAEWEKSDGEMREFIEQCFPEYFKGELNV